MLRVGRVLCVLLVAGSTSVFGQSNPLAASAPAGQAASALPRLIKFTGTLPEVQGTVAVTFAFYRDQTDGTPLWEEVQQVTPDGNGRYAIYLGATSPEGIPLDAFASGEARWLGVRVATQEEQPRVMLVSVPYALAAGDAQTLGGKPASAYLLQDPTAAAPPAGATGASLTTSRQGVSSTSPQAVASTPALLTSSYSADGMDVVFTDATGSYTGYSVQNLGSGAAAYSGMLFWDQNGALGQFQGFNNATHEYRINNIAKNGAAAFDGSINFMIGSSSKFLVASTGDVNLSGNLQMQGSTILARDAGGTSVTLGPGALPQTTTTNSHYNTAVGSLALPYVTSGTGNVAVGHRAGHSTTTGGSNVALGWQALDLNTTGSYNIAIGDSAAYFNTAGNSNIFIGASAGQNNGTGSYNIDIANPGNAADNATIRIGDVTQTRTFIAGIRGAATGNANAVPVLIDSNGQLGTASSSRRFKEDIHDMGEASRGLLRLRPVTFRYRQPFADGTKPVQYGLIAEEVADVCPDLVAYSGDGQIETVKYQVLDSMLLNELQRQQQEINAQKEGINAQREQINAQKEEIRGLKQQLTELREALASIARRGAR